MEIYRIAEQKMLYFNYSKHTIKIYTHYIEGFISKVNKSPDRLNAEDFSNYLNSYKFTSISQQNQVINALKFLYEKVLNKKYAKVDFERPRKEKRLPKIIETEFLLEKIGAIKNIKHKAVLSLAFSTGVRVSEIINLKLEDIDSKRMLINIRQAKGNKDRIVPLSPTILDLLRSYYKEYKPKEYLFNGQFSDQYTAVSCNQIVKKYIGQEYHMHLLRHSCFTNLLENGTDLRIIQSLAGHSSSKTTEIYTHVSKTMLNKIKLPI